LGDTNGGSLPDQVRAAGTAVKNRFPAAVLGFHCHNDSDLASANTLSALEAGVTQVQGCLNGYGERVGNANLTTLIPTLALKKGFSFSRAIHLRRLTDISHRVDQILNVQPRACAPYVGKSAFAHKGGMHISAVRKSANAYEHVDPALVGNQRDLVLSDQAGLSAVLHRAGLSRLSFGKNPKKARGVIEKVKKLEGAGYQFEGAEASFEILMKKELGLHRSFFDLIGFRVIVENRGDGRPITEATIKVRVGGKLENAVGEGDGPVNALDSALRKVLTRFYPALREVRLTDFKVRVLDAQEGTAAKVRVLIESTDKNHSWGTVGVPENILEASWEALVDSIDYKLLKDLERRKR
jgi:2-isopropylmalate synthase